MSARMVRFVSVAAALAAGLGALGCEDKDDGWRETDVDAAWRDATVGAGSDAALPDAAAPADVPAEVMGPDETLRFSLLHTNDLHSHLQGHPAEADYTPMTAADDATRGGFARLVSAIGAHRAAATMRREDVVLVDAGDFMMGTLFELAATTAASELALMHAVGYDAVALGNHELDWTPRGLAAILAAAVARNVNLPVLASNLKFDPVMPGDDELERLVDPGPLRRKLIKMLPESGLRVGFFGLLGKDAEQFSPTARPLTFDDQEATARAMVTELRTIDKVDLVIALSHSGIGADGRGEDRDLARKVAGIDVIVSGHTHEKLEKPVVEGRTIIVTAGSYGQYLGQLVLDVDKTAGAVTAVRVADYRLVPIDDQLPGHAATQAQIEQVISGIDAAIAPLQVGYKTVVAQTAHDLPQGAYAETALGDLITDAYLAMTRRLQPSEPADVAVDADGQIRAGIAKGKTGRVLFADLFRVLPLGIGPDGKPGSPLVTYYITGAELRATLEIAAGARALGSNQYTMQLAGVEADYDLRRNLFQRVVALRLLTPTGPVPIDTTDTSRCYKIVSTLYLASLFNLVGSLTGGVLSVQGKLPDCKTPVDPVTRLVDADPATGGVQELKNWLAFLSYVRALPDSDADGVPNIPASYAMPAGRIKQRTP